MGALFEHRDLQRWATTVGEAATIVPREVEKVVGRGALNIKKGAQKRIRGLAHARAYPYSIGYDVVMGLSGPYAEVGPDKNRRQGALGNLLEYGSVNNAPIPHIAPAVADELPRFAKACEELAVRALEQR